MTSVKTRLALRCCWRSTICRVIGWSPSTRPAQVGKRTSSNRYFGTLTTFEILRDRAVPAPATPTDPVQFYNVTSGVQLQQAFHDIALKLTSLYLSN